MNKWPTPIQAEEPAEQQCPQSVGQKLHHQAHYQHCLRLTPLHQKLCNLQKLNRKANEIYRRNTPNAGYSTVSSLHCQPIDWIMLPWHPSTQPSFRMTEMNMNTNNEIKTFQPNKEQKHIPNPFGPTIREDSEI